MGDDANERLMRILARQNGVMEWVRSTETLEFKRSWLCSSPLAGKVVHLS